MSRSTGRTTGDPVQAGWAELAAGSWQTARELFEGAPEAGESAEAQEGLSWAAWWLDDADAVFTARERAYRLYERAGRPESAARMAAWLAADELDFRGAVVVARAWVQRAHRLLASLDPGPEHGWLAFFDGYIASVAGDPATATARGREAAEIGRRFAVADLEMLGLALEGAMLVAAAEVEPGMRRLDEATTLALHEEAHVPISGAWACCFLVSACTTVRDYERAFEWCDRIAEFAERYGSRYMLAFCRAEYGVVHLWRGRWSDAEALLEASVEDFSRSRPAMTGAPLAGLAELRRRQGRRDEAEELLERAGATSSAQLGRARLAFDAGDARTAVDLCERYLRKLPDQLALPRAPALELLLRARIECGELDEAAAALASLRTLEQLAGTPALRAAADLAEGLLEAARGDHERARRLFEDAVDRFQRGGAPFETAQARIELATSLAQLGREVAAENELRAAVEALRALGAEAEAERADGRLAKPAGTGDAASEHGLTKRELEVLGLVAEGLTNRQVAERLVVSEHTVHRHVTSILRKLDAPSRTAAATYAVRTGVIDPANT